MSTGQIEQVEQVEQVEQAEQVENESQEAQHAPLDATALRKRAEQLLDSISEAGVIDDDVLLSQRARDLATHADDGQDSVETIDVVIFKIGHGSYAVSTSHTHHIVRLKSIAPIPGHRGSLLGVSVYAGDIIPVFDIAELLGEQPATTTTSGWALMIGEGSVEMAILVEQIETVASIRSSELELLSTAALRTEAGKFIAGATPEGLTFIDAGRLLAHESMGVAR